MSSNETKIAPRAFVYARSSSDRQSAASIDDQLGICTEWAAKQELLVAGSYTDQGISGARLIRPGAAPDAGPAPAPDVHQMASGASRTQHVFDECRDDPLRQGRDGSPGTLHDPSPRSLW